MRLLSGEVFKAQVVGIYCLTELGSEKVKTDPILRDYYRQRLSECKSVMRKAGLR